MKRILKLGLILILLLEFGSCQDVIVQTGKGAVQGFRVDYGNDTSQVWYGQADVFLGIPYVKPPVGALRFAKPETFNNFPGPSPLNATQFGNACPQPGDNFLGLHLSEDCLYMNIFTPNANSTYKYPVMLFIHGGAYTNGHAAEYPVRGIVRNFVSRGVIVVTFQYRLGMLGFFTTRTPEFPANLGLLDQVEAIKFVKEQIEFFGGNPYGITLFGQSAGSASVAAHTFSPLSQDLFQQAIMQSGSIFTCLDGSTGFKHLSEERAFELCNFTSTDWDAKNFTVLRDCLMNMPYEKFLDEDTVNFYGWNMVQDDNFLPDVPQNLFKNRPNIPVIYGNCHDEWSAADLEGLAAGTMTLDNFNSLQFDVINIAFLSVLALDHPERVDDLLSVVSSIYATPKPPDTDHVAWMKILNNAMTSAMFTTFTGREIDWYVYNNNTDVYTYEYDWPTIIGRPAIVPGWSPVFHSSDIFVLFMPDYYWTPLIENGTSLDQEIQVANFLGEAWTNFAKFGKPTTDDSWAPTTSLTDQEYYVINLVNYMETGFRRIDRMLWNQISPALIGDMPPPNPVGSRKQNDEL